MQNIDTAKLAPAKGEGTTTTIRRPFEKGRITEGGRQPFEKGPITEGGRRPFEKDAAEGVRRLTRALLCAEDAYWTAEHKVYETDSYHEFCAWQMHQHHKRLRESQALTIGATVTALVVAILLGLVLALPAA